MTPPEKEHIAKALQFELSKVETKEVRMRMLGHLVQINQMLAAQVSKVIGEELPVPHETADPKGTADVPEQSATLADATHANLLLGRHLEDQGIEHGGRPTQVGQGQEGCHPRGRGRLPWVKSRG